MLNTYKSKSKNKDLVLNLVLRLRLRLDVDFILSPGLSFLVLTWF